MSIEHSEPLPAHLVREELARIERSLPFRQSDQLRSLLRHLVEHTLAGGGDRLREMALGIDVFRRVPERFDPKRDPIVRVEAGRLRDKLARYYEDQGWNALVEIGLPVGSYQPVFRRRPHAPQTGLTIPSLVVLPVANLTGDPAQETFCDGFTDDLIDALSRLPGLKVIARTTTFQFKGTNEDVRLIGRRVGAATILEASVQQRGERVKVIAQLILASDGAHLWSRVFASNASDFYTLQQSLTQEIVDALQRQFSAHPAADGWAPMRRALVRRGTADAEARRLHDQARALQRRIRVDSQRRALELFYQAAARDPQFALAHSGAGAVWTNLASMQAEPASRAMPAALASAARALAIDPELAEAWSVRAYVAFRYQLDFAAAEEAYREGLRLNPSATYLRLGWTWLLTYTGRRDEAQAQFALLRELDPLDIGLRHNRAIFLWHGHEHEAAIAEAEAVLEIEPDDGTAKIVAALAHHALGQPTLAEEQVASLRRHAPDDATTIAVGALVAAGAGRTAEAMAALAELEVRCAEDALPALHVAGAWVAAGDFARAFSWLEQAAHRRDVHWAAVPVLPLFDPLKDDVRWPALLARHGLASAGSAGQP